MVCVGEIGYGGAVELCGFGMEMGEEPTGFLVTIVTVCVGVAMLLVLHEGLRAMRTLLAWPANRMLQPELMDRCNGACPLLQVE